MKHQPLVCTRRKIRIDIPCVALLIETSREAGRGILRGIERYIRQHGPWVIHLMQGDYLQKLLDTKAWGGSGIIARTLHPDTANAVLKCELPTVAIDLHDEQKAKGAPFQNCSEVYTDNIHVGTLGAEHLIQHRLEQFAFVGEINDVSWSRGRQSAFIARLAEAGFPCTCYPPPPRIYRDWGKEVHRLGNWLLSLPKPIALMAAHDMRGRQVIEACYRFSIDVPNEVAVLGVNDDQLVCNFCTPPMSSIAVDTETGGFRAAEMLDNLMHREKKWRGKRCFPFPPMKYAMQPIGVVSRRSTEFWLVDDEIVIEALKFIHINSALPLTAKQVVNHLNISRRSLEMRFQKHLHRSILSEINRYKLERIKLMLRDRSMNIHDIALACSFESAAYMCCFFRRETGQTMSEYRKEF